MSKEIYVSLDLKEFRALVRGGQVDIKTKEGTTIKMILKDIGFDAMHEVVTEATWDSPLSFKEESIEVRQ